MDLLTEGVYDKGIFKAVFMAGGPGSGKSFMAKNIFGIPEKANVSVSGLRTVNSDKQFIKSVLDHKIKHVRLVKTFGGMIHFSSKKIPQNGL